VGDNLSGKKEASAVLSTGFPPFGGGCWRNSLSKAKKRTKESEKKQKQSKQIRNYLEIQYILKICFQGLKDKQNTQWVSYSKSEKSTIESVCFLAVEKPKESKRKINNNFADE